MSRTSKNSPLKLFFLMFIWLKRGRECWQSLGNSDLYLGKAASTEGSSSGPPEANSSTYTALCSVHLSLLYVLTQATNQSTLNSPLTFPKHLCVKCLSKLPSTVVCWCEMSTPSENRRERCAKVCRDPAAGLMSLQQSWDVLASQL